VSLTDIDEALQNKTSNGDRGPGPSGGRGSSKRGGRQKDSRPAKSAKSSEDFTSGDSARKDGSPLSAIIIKLKILHKMSFVQ